MDSHKYSSQRERDARFRRTPRSQREHPRKVAGGVKLRGSDGPTIESWIGKRWMRFLDVAASLETLADGVSYATQGQTASLRIEPGRVLALVQGRDAIPYRVELAMDLFEHEKWDRIVSSIADQPGFAARILAGSIPVEIEDLFAPLGVRLFPSEDDEVRTTCSRCDGVSWCKHACCVALLLAEKFERDPLLLFALRGLAEEDLLERLRRRRAVVGSASGQVDAYTARPVAAAQTPDEPLEMCMDHFWTAGHGCEEIETPIQAPEVEHALLKRLGTSPFTGARFPMVGLLATCYDTISKAAIADASKEDVEV